MLLTISLRPEAAKLYDLFKVLEDQSVTQLIALQIRQERNRPGRLAEAPAKTLESFFQRGAVHGPWDAESGRRAKQHSTSSVTEADQVGSLCRCVPLFNRRQTQEKERATERDTERVSRFSPQDAESEPGRKNADREQP